jgi:succinoglycan biosynthesis transport protein ExoP
MTDERLIRAGVQPSIPTLRETAMILFRQRKVFVWAWAIVFLAAIAYLVTGDRYQAHMKLMVRPGRADAPASAQENAPLDLTRLAITEEALNSEVELLRDDEVLRQVVEENGLTGRDWFHFLRLNEGRSERVERAARRLGRKLQIEPVKKTTLISVGYSSGNPRQAASVLQSLANAYMQKHTVVLRPSGEAHFFEQQTEESRRQLEEAQRNLGGFAAGHGVVQAALERDLALQKLSEVDASYRRTRIDMAQVQQRIVELEKRLAAIPERTTTQIRVADNPELLRSLKSSLLDLQLKRTDLLTKFEPNHPLVQEVEQQISQAQTAIAAENAAPLHDETTDKNPHYEWATSELERAQVDRKALAARASATVAQEASYRTLTQQLGQEAVVQDDLLNREKNAEDNYLLYVKKLEEARLADALDQRGIVNVAIAEEPIAPALPIWSTLNVLAVGLLAAGAVGTGAAFMADYLDPGFRTPDDVRAYLEVPVLASLPSRGRREISA